MHQCRRFTVFCLFALLALPALGQPGDTTRIDLASLLSTPSACAAPVATNDGAESVATAPLLFYSISNDLLTDGRNQVQVQAWVDGELYLQEGFTINSGAVEATRERALEAMRSSHPEGPEAVLDESVPRPTSTTFELLADRNAIRAQLYELAAEHAVTLEVTVNGGNSIYSTFDDFTRTSADTVASAGLPTATNATAQVFAISANKPDAPQNFYVCGDGSCGGGTPPIGENCESCPADCGGPCSVCGNGYCGGTEDCSTCPSDCGACASCPYDRGTEQRQQYLGSTPYSSYCMDAWPGTMYYTYTRNDYKRWTVQLTEECDGSITETVVPGSTSYFSTYCWKYTGIYCSYSYGYASPICF